MKRNAYVNRWLADQPHVISVDTDLISKGIAWCKENCEPNEWHFKRKSFVKDSHIMSFEHYHDYVNFCTEVLN